MTTQRKARQMICACCGGYAGRWKQHWNQDDGFGICAGCIKWVRGRGMTESEIIDIYGTEGENWGLAA